MRRNKSKESQTITLKEAKKEYKFEIIEHFKEKTLELAIRE
jgi:hypothetical protein